jgi:DNA-binding MarR family transcriptional regulator
MKKTKDPKRSVLQGELKMSKGFSSLEEEAYLNMARTFSILDAEHDEVFKSKGITGVQYNVLRILRGAGDKGLPSLEIASRMVTRVPDITRLVNRLLSQELVTRERSAEDRRVVYVAITRKGKDILKSLDKKVNGDIQEQFGALTKKELSTLNELLVKARQ